MQESTSQTQIGHLTCCNKNSVKFFCSNQLCEKPGSVCRVQQCQCIPKQHRSCEFIYAQDIIERIHAKKCSLTPDVQKAIIKINSVYEQAIQKLSQDREQLAKWKQNFGLSIEQISFMQLVQENKVQKITGKLVHQLKKTVDAIDNNQWLTQKWVQDFWKKKKDFFEKAFSSFRKLITISSYSSKKSQLYQSKFNFQLNFGTEYAQNYEKIKNQEDKVIYQKSKDQGNWHQLCSIQSLPDKGKSYFQVEILLTKSSRIAIGVCTKQGATKRKAPGSQGNVLYVCNGQLWIRNSSHSGNEKIFDKSIVKVIINQNEKQISWIINQRVIKSASLQSLNGQELYASISCIDTEDRFAII